MGLHSRHRHPISRSFEYCEYDFDKHAAYCTCQILPRNSLRRPTFFAVKTDVRASNGACHCYEMLRVFCFVFGMLIGTIAAFRQCLNPTNTLSDSRDSMKTWKDAKNASLFGSPLRASLNCLVFSDTSCGSPRQRICRACGDKRAFCQGQSSLAESLKCQCGHRFNLSSGCVACRGEDPRCSIKGRVVLRSLSMFLTRCQGPGVRFWKTSRTKRSLLLGLHASWTISAVAALGFCDRKAVLMQLCSCSCAIIGHCGG